MIRFLYTGDWHLRGTNPRNRIDDYVAAVEEKLQEIYSLAEKWDCKAIIMPGDVWDRPEVSISVLLSFAKLLAWSPVEIYATPGNHDVYGYNVSTYERSSLKLLELLVPQLHVLTDPSVAVYFPGVRVTFSPFSSKMDINGYGYSPEVPPSATTPHYNIHVAHGMLLNHKPPFDRYTDINDVQTTADMVLTGHDHTGYGIYNRSDGKVFCNPGALMRLAASHTEIERPIQVALITVDDGKSNIELIPLQCAKPGEEVLDRSKIEAETARQYAMDTFSAAIQTSVGEKVIMDVNQIIETIAAQEGSAPHIVKAALEAIDAQREKVKG